MIYSFPSPISVSRFHFHDFVSLLHKSFIDVTHHKKVLHIFLGVYRFRSVLVNVPCNHPDNQTFPTSFLPPYQAMFRASRCVQSTVLLNCIGLYRKMLSCIIYFVRNFFVRYFVHPDNLFYSPPKQYFKNFIISGVTV